MLKKQRKMTLEVSDDFADRVAERLLAACRDQRRHFWKRLGYLLTLVGAVSGLVTLLVMLLERWWG